MNEYLNVIRNNYANFSGRAHRREYWMFALINFIIVTVLQLPALVSLPAALATTDSSGQSTSPLMVPILVSGLLLLVYGLAIIVPSLAVTARRLHDTGRSGWWYLITFVPLIGSLILLVFTVTDSEPGENKWGPSPKGQSAVPAAANW